MAVGGAIGGSIMGFGLGAVGASVGLQQRAALGIVVLAALGVGMLSRKHPFQIDSETSQGLMTLGPRRWALINGLLLGMAVWSRIGFWLWWAIPLSAFISGSAAVGAAIWGGYGLSRNVLAATAGLSLAKADTEPREELTMHHHRGADAILTWLFVILGAFALA